MIQTATMRAEFVAYMRYSEGPEYPEYVMHIVPKVFWDPNYWNMLLIFSHFVLPNKHQKITKHVRGVHIKGICCVSSQGCFM